MSDPPTSRPPSNSKQLESEIHELQQQSQQIRKMLDRLSAHQMQTSAMTTTLLNALDQVVRSQGRTSGQSESRDHLVGLIREITSEEIEASVSTRSALATGTMQPGRIARVGLLFPSLVVCGFLILAGLAVYPYLSPWSQDATKLSTEHGASDPPGADTAMSSRGNELEPDPTAVTVAENPSNSPPQKPEGSLRLPHKAGTEMASAPEPVEPVPAKIDLAEDPIEPTKQPITSRRLSELANSVTVGPEPILLQQGESLVTSRFTAALDPKSFMISEGFSKTQDFGEGQGASRPTPPSNSPLIGGPDKSQVARALGDQGANYVENKRESLQATASQVASTKLTLARTDLEAIQRPEQAVKQSGPGTDSEEAPNQPPVDSPNRDQGVPPEIGIEIQTNLKRLGFYRGAVDGIVGPNTKIAIRKFQASIGSRQTGVMTPQETFQLAQTASTQPTGSKRQLGE